MKCATTLVAALTVGLAIALQSSAVPRGVASGADRGPAGPGTTVASAGVEGTAEPAFDSFRVETRSPWIGSSVVTVSADGSYVFEVPGGKRGTPGGAPCVARYRLSAADLHELVALLERTNWLGAADETPHLAVPDATLYNMVLVRGGKETPAVHADGVQTAGAYGDLVHFVDRLTRQEELLLAVTNKDGPGGHRLTGGELDALMGIGWTSPPHAPALDYGRLVPAYEAILHDPEGWSPYDVEAGVKLMAYLRLRSQRPSLEALARGGAIGNPSYKPTPYVRDAAVAALARLGPVESLETLDALAADEQVSRAVAEALLAAPVDKAAPILVRVANVSPDAAWALIRMGDAAEPAILQILRRPGDEVSSEAASYNIIRQYFEHWNELLGPPSPKVLAAIHDKVESVAGSSSLTSRYGLKLLEQADDPFVPRNARQALQSYLAMAADERQTERRRLLSAIHFRLNPAGEFGIDAQNGALLVTEVYECREDNAAWARVTGREDGIDYAVRLGLLGGLVWEIAYAKALPEAGMERERARFLAAHPDAQEIAAGVGEITPDTPARNENAIRQMAVRFMKAVRDGDIASLKAWSIGSAHGWVTAEEAAKLGGNTPVGWSAEGLEEAARRLRDEVYAGNADLLLDVVEVSARNDWAAVHVSVPNGTADAEHEIVMFARTEAGWRMVDMGDSTGTMFRASARRLHAVMKFHAALRVLRESQAHEEAVTRNARTE
jgi:hypothetical protein